VGYFGLRTGLSGCPSAADAEKSTTVPCLINGAAVPCVEEAEFFEHSAMRAELAGEEPLEEEALPARFNSSEMFEEQEEEWNPILDLFGNIDEAPYDCASRQLHGDEALYAAVLREGVDAAVGIGAGAATTGAGATVGASAGEPTIASNSEQWPPPLPHEPPPSGLPPVGAGAPTPLEALIANTRKLVTSLVQTKAPGPHGRITSQSKLAEAIGWGSRDLSNFMTGKSSSRGNATLDRTALGKRAGCLVKDLERVGLMAQPSATPAEAVAPAAAATAPSPPTRTMRMCDCDTDSVLVLLAHVGVLAREIKKYDFYPLTDPDPD